MKRYILQNNGKLHNIDYVCKLLKSELKNKIIMNKSITKWLFSAVFMLAGATIFGQIVPSASTYKGCETEPIQFFANSPSATSYSWDFGNGASSINENPSYSYATAGTYTVKLAVTRNGTTTSGSFVIKILKAPIFDVILDTNVLQCFQGNNYCYKIVTSDSICSTTVTWSDGTGIKSSKFYKDTFEFCKSFTINPFQQTAYDMTVEITSCNGCTSKKTYSKTADVLPRLGVNFWSSQPIGCGSVTAAFVNKSFIPRANVTRFIWFFGDGTVDSVNWAANPDTLYHTYTTKGTFTAKLYVETPQCSDTFILVAAATNFVFDPYIVADKDSACLDAATFTFTVVDGPTAGIRSIMWHFLTLPIEAMPCSGCEDNDQDYPVASFTYGGAGPVQVSLYITHRYCPNIVVLDTIQVIGAQSVIENSAIPVQIAQNQKYQCVIQDTVRFTNLSKFYHNDFNYINDDSAYVWSTTDTFKMLFGNYGNGNEQLYGYQLDDTTVQIFTKAGAAYTLVSTRYLVGRVPFAADSVRAQKFYDGQLVHHFKPNQTAYVEERWNECTIRIWDFDDPYAPQCTTNTKGGINVGKNCAYSMDSLPQHMYSNWDSAMAFDRLRPLTTGIFDEANRACNLKTIWYSDSNAIIESVSPFVGKDSFYTIGIGGEYINNDSQYRYIISGDTFIFNSNSFVRNVMLPKFDSMTRDTIPLAFYDSSRHKLIGIVANAQINRGTPRTIRDTLGSLAEVACRDVTVIDTLTIPASQKIIKAETIVYRTDNGCSTPCPPTYDTLFVKADTINIPAQTLVVVDETYYASGDSIDRCLYRTLFYNSVVRCNTVVLKHFDTCHPFRCEHQATVSLALTPPNAKGLRWTGIRCLAGAVPPHGIAFDVSGVKPGCTQDHIEFNFDSASGINNWVNFLGIPRVAQAPPYQPNPPPLPYPAPNGGTYATGYGHVYGALNITDRVNGWVTVGLIIGNGAVTTNPCFDTLFYNRMLKFRFADAAYTITKPAARDQRDKVACRYDEIYFQMRTLTQPEVEYHLWNWGDGNIAQERKLSYDPDPNARNFFLNRIATIDRYLYDTANLSGRLTPWAALKDSIAQGWIDSAEMVKRGWKDSIITLSCKESVRYGLTIPHSKDSIAKWLANPNVLIGWMVLTRAVNKDVVKEQNQGRPYSGDTILRDTFLTSIVLDYEVTATLDPAITPLIVEAFERLGFDYYELPATQISKFFGAPGKGGCIDTTGLSQFITLDFREKAPCDIKRFSSRDTNIIQMWKHVYEVSGIFSPQSQTRTRVDACSDNSSQQIKIGFGKEVCFSDTVLCKGKTIYGLANFWYWTTDNPNTITDIRDYWREPQRIIDGKEKATLWDWHIGDGSEFVKNQDSAGLGIGTNPGWFNRYRPNGPGPGITIKKNLTTGKILGSPNGPTAVYYLTPGVYNLAMLATDSNSCEDTTFQKIYVSDVTADYDFDNDRPGCKTFIELLDKSFVIDGCNMADSNKHCDSIMEWFVDWGDGSPIGGKNDANRDARLIHDYTRNGTFTVKLIVNSLLGCSDTIEKILFIPGPIPAFDGDVQTICKNNTVYFNNRSTNPSPAASWILDYGDGFTENLTDVSDTFSHKYTKAGVYNIFLTQYDSIVAEGKFCNAIYPDTTNGQQKLITITVIELDTTDIIADDTTVCIGQPILFSNTTPNLNDTTWDGYTWIFDIDNVGGDSITTGDSTVLYAYQKAGVYRATVVPQYNKLLPQPYCPYRDTIRIYVDSVKADFTYDTTSTPKICFKNTSFNGNTYRWWFDVYKDSVNARAITNSAEQSVEKDPCFTYDSLGCYYVVLEATSPDGCKDTTIQVVCNTFKFFIKAYNTFTPGKDNNGDGFNDVFDIPIEGQNLYELVIYNRYGTKVFESDDANNDWNGKLFNTGPMAADGTYYYYLRYRNKREDGKDPQELFGVIFLMR